MTIVTVRAHRALRRRPPQRLLSACVTGATPVHRSRAKELWLTLPVHGIVASPARVGRRLGSRVRRPPRRRARARPRRDPAQGRLRPDRARRASCARARRTASCASDELPAVGDWVGFDPDDEPDRGGARPPHRRSPARRSGTRPASRCSRRTSTSRSSSRRCRSTSTCAASSATSRWRGRAVRSRSCC